MSNYYYLVTGLADISFDDEKLLYSFLSFREEIYNSVTKKDQQLIDLIYQQYDHDNLLYLLANFTKPDKREEDNELVDNVIESRGLFTKDELFYMILAIKNGDEPSSVFPEYMVEFVNEFFLDSLDINSPIAKERLLTLFFQYTQTVPNIFVRRWFEFNMDLNNIIAGFIARKHSLDINTMIVGDNYVAKAVSHSGARDWGLSLEIDFFDELAIIQEESQLTEREKKIDMLKWNWLDNNSFFNYFSIEKLFSFIIKIEIVERWITLDKEKGQRLFRALIESLKQDVEIPAEYR